jgi:hypothetical protein
MLCRFMVQVSLILLLYSAEYDNNCSVLRDILS